MFLIKMSRTQVFCMKAAWFSRWLLSVILPAAPRAFRQKWKRWRWEKCSAILIFVFYLKFLLIYLRYNKTIEVKIFSVVQLQICVFEHIKFKILIQHPQVRHCSWDYRGTTGGDSHHADTMWWCIQNFEIVWMLW